MLGRASGAVIGAWACVGALVALTAAVLGVPGFAVVAGILDGLRSAAGGDPDVLLPTYRLLWPTLGWSAAIGLVSAACGLPLAWWSMGGGRWRSLAVLLPMVLPMALVYAALNQARSPGTALGDWLAMGPSWRAVLAGRLIAVAGLALWASPVAAVVWRLVLRGVEPEVFEFRRSDGGGRVAVGRLALRLTAWGWVPAAGAVGLLMIGSAVPLHLARVPTFSIELWLALDSAGSAGAWRVWLRAWPIGVLAVVASIAAVVLLRGGGEQGFDSPAPLRGGSMAAVGAAAVLVLAAIVPMGLLAWSMEEFATFGVLWRTEGEALRSSWVLAALVAGFGCGVVWLTRVGADRAPTIVAAVLVCWLTAALLPGVLVGSALGSAWSGVDWIADGPSIVLLAHAARVLAWPMLVGAWLAWSEPISSRERRLADGAAGPWSIVVADGPVLIAACVVGGVVAGALSLSEIEAGIVVAPPGSASVARSMLGMLHFARDEHLSGLMLMQAGSTMVLLALGVVAAWLFGRVREPSSGAVRAD